MKERSIGIILGTVNIVLLAVLFFFFSLRDRTAPEIYIEEISLIYRTGMEENILLEGVSAVDEEDGDISDSIVIEKIVTDPKNGTAVITYGVRDKAGNMAKASKKVEMEMEAVEDEAVVDENADSEAADEENSTNPVPAEDADREDREPGEENENSEDETASEDEEDSEVENRNDEDEEATENNLNNENREALPAAGEAGNTVQNVSSRQNPGRPSIVFRTQEVKVKAGGTPAWVDAIEGLHDDKDDYVYLLGTLKVEGEYDRNTLGTYEVKVTTTDSDGNVSNSYPVKIVVEE